MDIRLLLAGLREYSSMEALTPEVVNKIIKRIEVHNSETVNGHKRVGVDILLYRCRTCRSCNHKGNACYRRIVKAVIYHRKRKGRSLHNRGCDQLS